MNLPEPLDLPWTMKPLSSAVSGVDVLDDGRLHCSIRHDVLHGVTPEMLVWWFDNIDGDVLIEGVRHARYRVWHPRDHVAHTYVRGRGRGAVFRIHEVLARNPAWAIDVRTEVTQLDLHGFAHRPRPHGLPIVRMDYTFARCAGGTRYTNSLTFGAVGMPRVNAALRKLAFSLEKARAWLRHNIEEVGNFEFFLPALYAAEGRV